MLVNSSLVSNDSLLSIFSSLPLNMECFFISPSSLIFCGFYITLIVIILPLSILILCHGLQQCRQHWPSSEAANVSHSDCFTYHLAAMQLIGVTGCICCCYGVYKQKKQFLLNGDYMWCFSWFGETIFQMLTCVEQYVAVVHPITYQNLRNGRGIKIRNNAICVVWLVCIISTCSMLSNLLIVNGLMLSVDLAVVFFCNLCVLFALVRPGPGEKLGFTKKRDQQKHRAFFIILSILAVLVLRLAMNVFWLVVTVSELNNECLILACSMWLTVPSSLSLPLLFLHRAAKQANRNNVK